MTLIDCLEAEEKMVHEETAVQPSDITGCLNQPYEAKDKKESSHFLRSVLGTASIAELLWMSALYLNHTFNCKEIIASSMYVLGGTLMIKGAAHAVRKIIMPRYKVPRKVYGAAAKAPSTEQKKDVRAYAYDADCIRNSECSPPYKPRYNPEDDGGLPYFLGSVVGTALPLEVFYLCLYHFTNNLNKTNIIISAALTFTGCFLLRGGVYYIKKMIKPNNISQAQ